MTSISWEGLGASWAGSQHHEHQLGWFGRQLGGGASIMASAGKAWASVGQGASIMSISSDGLGASWAGEPAS